MKTLEPGLYENISFTDYRAIDAVNASYLSDIKVSPSHAKQIKERGYTTKTLEFGSAVHCAVLEADKFIAEYVIYEGKTRRGKEWDKFKAEHEGCQIIKMAEYREIMDLTTAINAHPLAQSLLDLRDGLNEVTIIWEEPLSGTLCKSRIDRYCPGILVDLKTSRSIAPFSFNRDFVTYKYPLKMAFYADAIRSLVDDPLSVKIIVAQNKPTIDVGVYDVPEEVLDYGRGQYQTALAELQYCQANNEWPGLLPYDEAIITLPDWVRKNEEADGFDWAAA